MIQRRQTLYLLLAFVVLVVCVFVGLSDVLLSILAGVMALGALGDVFLFNKRPLQATLCVVIMAVGVAYYIVIAARQPQLEWHMVLPLCAVFLVFLARKGIIHDEKLVRSLDRIR